MRVPPPRAGHGATPWPACKHGARDGRRRGSTFPPRAAAGTPCLLLPQRPGLPVVPACMLLTGAAAPPPPQCGAPAGVGHLGWTPQPALAAGLAPVAVKPSHDTANLARSRVPQVTGLPGSSGCGRRHRCCCAAPVSAPRLTACHARGRPHAAVAARHNRTGQLSNTPAAQHGQDARQQQQHAQVRPSGVYGGSANAEGHNIHQ